MTRQSKVTLHPAGIYHLNGCSVRAGLSDSYTIREIVVRSKKGVDYPKIKNAELFDRP